MQRPIRRQTVRYLRLTAVLVVALATGSSQAQGVGDARSNAARDDIAALKAENERRKSLVPSQSHAMMDVACNGLDRHGSILQRR